MPAFLKNEWTTFAGAVLASLLTGILVSIRANAILTFLISAIALTALATVIGHATEQLGNYLGPGATGILQAAVGNLPELFVGFFALQAGLVKVVQSALVGSILANSLLVLGLAFFFGGRKNGIQKFHSETPRVMVMLMVLAVSALVMPTLAHSLHTPASVHEIPLSVAGAVVLLILFVASVLFSLYGGRLAEMAPMGDHEENRWPMWRVLSVLAIVGASAAFVSDWFVEALSPATESLGISQAFAGLVLVAIAGNAVENIVGIRLAIKDRMNYAISIILNSSLQIAFALTPILVLLSFFFTSTVLTLVLPPLLVVALALTAILSALIVYDGESNWLEGLALIGLYALIAMSFWWG